MNFILKSRKIYTMGLLRIEILMLFHQSHSQTFFNCIFNRIILFYFRSFQDTGCKMLDTGKKFEIRNAKCKKKGNGINMDKGKRIKEKG